MSLRLAALAAASVLLLAASAHADPLDDIRKSGLLTCAVSQDTDDFSQYDAHGDLSAFGADLCGAVAAAILGDAHKARIKPEGDEITALRDVVSGRAQVMFGATPDPTLGLALHLRYGPAVLIDGTGFLVDGRDRIRTVADLAGRSVCWIDGTPAAETVTEGLDALHVAYLRFPFQERGEMESALATGHCAAVGASISELANLRQSLPALRDHFRVLPQTIGADPVAPAVAERDPHLAAVVDAVMFGLVDAEAHDVTKSNARDPVGTDPIRRRLLGADPWIGHGLGLADTWLRDAVAAVGNAGEIYARDVGEHAALGLPVGPNRPVSMGGALLELPVESAR